MQNTHVENFNQVLKIALDRSESLNYRSCMTIKDTPLPAEFTIGAITQIAGRGSLTTADEQLEEIRHLLCDFYVDDIRRASEMGWPHEYATAQVERLK